MCKRLYLFAVGNLFWTALCLVILAGLTSCHQPGLDSAYVEEIEAWKERRLASLKSPTGWTTLAGLFWIDEGENSMGADPANDIRMPEDFPKNFGVILLHGDSLYFRIDPAVTVRVNDSIFREGPVHTDLQGNPEVFEWQHYSWYFIKREQRTGIRLRDTLHPARQALQEIPAFRINRDFIYTAIFSPPGPEETIRITNVIGDTTEDPTAGKLSFIHNDAEYTLTALNGGPSSLWLIFSDETTGDETYGGGRYIYVPRPDSNGVVVIDFNKAYNPPCAFTDFATCPLPPKENHLSFAVRAGEKSYHHD